MKPTVQVNPKINQIIVSTSKTIIPLTMKTILLLLLFVSGFAYAQPVITTPPPIQMCDNNNDGFEVWDLTINEALIVNGAPNLSVSYYETLTDSQNMVNPITNPTTFANIMPSQTIYVAVIDPSDPGNPAFTSFDLLLSPTAIANTPPDLYQIDIPYDGHAAFDLQSTYNTILAGQTGMTVTCFTTLADAQSNSAMITNLSSYVNSTNPQTIFVRVENAATGCFSTTSFQLIVTNPDIVYIPDPTFKSQLLFGNIAYDEFQSPVVLDTNGDGELQVTEALLAYRLDVSNPFINSLEGILSFHNLRTLYVYGCNLNSLDVSGLQNLSDLRCEYNGLYYLNVTNCPSMITMFCGGNMISTLDLTGKPMLSLVWCELNQITALNVTGSPLLQALSCRNNSLSTLDLTNNTALTDLNCGMNNITSLDISHCTNLINFHCAGAPVTAFDFTGLNNIANLNIRYTNATTIDVSNMPNLSQLNVDGNMFTSLDLSQNPNLCNFQCSNSNTLTQLNIKNGDNPCFSQYVIAGNSNLQFVCTDDMEASYFEIYFTNVGSQAVVNSYCSFLPGGNYNTITGNLTFDGNNNGCDSNDIPQPNIKININDGSTQGSTFTSLSGGYSFYTSTGSFTLTPEVEHPTWFSFSPNTNTVTFVDANNNTTTSNFCITPVGIHTDLEIVITPLTPARPGFEATYKLVYRNKGNVIPNFNSGVRLEYNPNQMTFVSASQAVGTLGTNFINFDYNNLLPFESRSIEVTFHINSPVDANPVLIGDILQFHANIGLNIGDENPEDNDFIYNQTVIGSFDPNAITCLEGGNVSPIEIGKYLHYGITFENTGNYQAENVIVKDVIDTNLYDVSSLQVMKTSHPAYVKITGNVVEFIFKNINLDAASGNPPVGGHGDVLFKIKSKNTLVAGDYVSKTAKIYFDYNAPIDTNNAQTTFQLLSNPIQQWDNSVTVYPNPTNALIHISSTSTIKTIQLFDVQGRLLETDLAADHEVVFDLSSKQNGIYFLKITSEQGSKVQKVVKE